MASPMTDNGRTTSVWMATAPMPQEPALEADARADVCIVGAGTAGLTTAYLLSKSGKQVVVVDDGPTAGGETCRTTAHLVSALDDHVLKYLRGVADAAKREGARIYNGTHVDRIEGGRDARGGNDVWLHAVLGAAAAYFGFIASSAATRRYA